MMKIKTIKKQMKLLKANIANLALGHVPNATYRDLYNAIWDAESALRKVTDTTSPKAVLMAHVSLEEMQEVRQLAYNSRF